MEEIQFKRPEIEDRELIESYFRKYPSRAVREHLSMYFYGQDTIK